MKIIHVFLLMLFIISLLGCKKDSNSDDIPANPNSKYLLIDSEQLELLRAEAHTSRAEIWGQIYEFVENVRTGNDGQIASLPPEQSPSGANQNFFRNHGDAMGAIALSALISEDASHIDLAIDYLMAACSWEVWDIPRNDLGHIHMIIGVSLAYSWMQEYLNTDEKAFISGKLTFWVQDRYNQAVGEYNYEQNNWWRKSYLQNHCGSNYAAIGIAALALKDEEPLAADWLDIAKTNWERIRFLLNSTGDGTWHEGASYQWYQLETALPFLIALRQKTGEDLLPDNQLKALSDFWTYNHLPGNYQWMMPYGNVSVWESGHTAPPALLRIIASEYNDGYAARTAEKLLEAGGRYANVWAFPYATYEFLLFNPEVPKKEPNINSHTLSHYFSDAEAVVWRSSWDDDALIFGLKAGPFGGRFAYSSFHAGEYPFDEPESSANVGHDHRDAGNIWIAKGGDWLLPEDVQYGGYETSLHNTLLIDGQGQAIYTQDNPGYDALTRGEKNDATVNDVAGDQHYYEYIETDLTKAYAYISGVNRMKRYVVYLRPDVFLLVDDAKTEGQREISHIVHAEASIHKESDFLTLKSESGTTLRLQTISPASSETSIGTTDYGMPEARVKMQGNNVRMAHMYYIPGSNPAGNPSASLIENTGQATALRVDFDNGTRTDIFLNLTGNNSTPEVSPVTIGNRSFNRRLLLVFYDENLNEIRSIEH